MRILPHPPDDVGLSRDEAQRAAWTIYGTDSPAVTELLLLAHDPDISRLKRYQANMALEWFDPSVELPRARGDEDEPEAVKLLKAALLHGDMRVRIAAGNDLTRMLKPTNVWQKVGVR